LSADERIARMRPLINSASRELIMRAAAASDTPDSAFAPLAGYLVERWGADALLRDASGHRSARDKWRRTTALRILVRLPHPRALELLARAVEEGDVDVAATAFA